jgi:predicted nucleic acid-binding protein
VILLDTCVISELARPTPDPAVLAWLATRPDESLRLSVLTLGEIRKGAELLEPGPRRRRVEEWLDGLHTGFADRLLPVDREVALRWGVICAEQRRAGRVRPAVDTLLAATAVRHGMPLATRNVADFAGTGAVVIDPWSALPG